MVNHALHDQLKQFEHELDAEMTRQKQEGREDPPAGCVSSLLSRFDNGLDCNAQDKNGRTPLGLIAHLTRGGSRLANTLAVELLDRGANPLINDRALGKAICHEFSSSLLMETLSKLSKLEAASRGARDEHGGNFLHYLLAHHPDIAAEQLEEDTYYDNMEDRLFTPDTALALRALDHANVLHALWETPKPVHQAHYWPATKQLLVLGADPLACDQRGHCAAQWMQRALEQGLPEPLDDTWDRIRSDLENALMQCATLPATCWHHRRI